MRFLVNTFYLLVFLPLLSATGIRPTPVQEETGPDTSSLEVTTVASHLDVPWEITWGPDNWIWFTEQSGTVSKVNPATGEVKLLLRIVPDVYRNRTLGLLCMALHPDMEHFPYVYLNYTYMKGKDLWSRWARYTYDGTKLGEPLTLLEVPANVGHNGSRIAFAPDGKLMLATGDADPRNDERNGGNAQNLESLSGKILRLNIDGTVPEDNPFPGSAVWALGFRVPQGLVYASNGKLYSAEHGNVINDEVNLIQRGANYGYPNVSGVCDTPKEKPYCEAHDIKPPLMAWTPTIAPSGLDYYNHPAIPEWQNSLLLVTLKTQSLRVLKLNQKGDAVLGEKVYFEKEFGRLRDVCVSPDGDVYVSTSNRDWNPAEGFPMAKDDRILKISKRNTTVTATPSKAEEANAETSAQPRKTAAAHPGEATFTNYCATCHKANGEGVAGTFPPLKNSSWVRGDKDALIRVILHGLSEPITVDGVRYEGDMPAFNFLTDAQIADLVEYVRSEFGNKKDKVSEKEVARIRKSQ